MNSIPFWKRLPIAMIASLVGITWTAVCWALFRDDYFYVTLIAAGVTMLLLAPVATSLLLGIPWFTSSRLRLGLVMAAAILGSWIAALGVMGITNLTPLCVGANNGDGTNSIGMCAAYTILYAIFYTPLVVVGAIPCALLAALFRPR